MKISWHIETRLIAELVPHPKNPRQFTEKGMKDLGRSIDAFGLAEPIVINTDGLIIGGHARYKILLQRNETECDCYVPERQLTDKEVEELNIRLNANTAGVWDTERLANEWELAELMDWGLDLSEFKNLEAQEDDYVIPDEIVTDIKRGDIFQIGENRLMCGDSVNAEDVSKLLDGNSPIICVTDPPYGVNYDPTWRHRARIINSRRQGKVANDDNARWLDAYLLFPGNVIYIWCASLRSAEVHQDIIDAGFIPDYQIIWNKQQLTFGRGDYHWKHEPCWYAHRKGKAHNWQGSRTENTVWDITSILQSKTKEDEANVHGTQKPIECMARPIRNNSKEGESVYDPFLGSGTTLLAAHSLKRICYCLEICPQYCAISLQRVKKYDNTLQIKCLNRTFDIEKEIKNALEK